MDTKHIKRSFVVENHNQGILNGTFLRVGDLKAEVKSRHRRKTQKLESKEMQSRDSTTLSTCYETRNTERHFFLD